MPCSHPPAPSSARQPQCWGRLLQGKRYRIRHLAGKSGYNQAETCSRTSPCTDTLTPALLGSSCCSDLRKQDLLTPPHTSASEMKESILLCPFAKTGKVFLAFGGAAFFLSSMVRKCSSMRICLYGKDLLFQSKFSSTRH